MNTDNQIKRRWYALKVYFNKVSDMEAEITAAGVEAYVPYLKKEKETDKPVAIVPSLMFFRSSERFARKLKDQVQGRAMVYTRRMETGWAPAAIPDKEMNIFRLVVSSGDEGLEYFESDTRVFHRGERVRVTGGMFAGAEGQIVRVKGNRRLIVSLTGICAIATSYIPQCFLEKLDPQ